MWWLILFTVGLIIDLVLTGRLGQTSFILLIVGLIVELFRKWLPQKTKEIKLKL